MHRSALLFAACLPLTGLFAQYPLVRGITLLDGQQGVNVTCIAQDAQGLIWLGSSRGVFRTDGDRTDAVLRTEGDAVTAICSGGRHVIVALASGSIIRCDGRGCDTLWTDTTFRETPVRSLLVDARAGIWAGTYGNGTHVWRTGHVTHVNAAHGLNDDHVNAQCRIDSARVAIATDQGIAIVAPDGTVRALFGEEQGAPDNLVLSLCASGGRLWAGSDRAGVFSFDPDRVDRGVQRIDSVWTHGPVAYLTATPGRLWLGTSGHGTVVCDLTQGLAYYRPGTTEQGARSTVRSILRGRSGEVWWCDGSSLLRRADPDVVITPMHEGFDMRRVTALARGVPGRIAFATRDGVFTHATTFIEDQRFLRVRLPVDSTTEVVALHTDARGQLWAGTFGRGVFRIAGDGSFVQPGDGHNAINENVLAIRSQGDSVLFATIGGVFLWTYTGEGLAGHFAQLPIPGSGFTYDVMPMPDGSVLVATDGSGVVRIDKGGQAHSLLDESGLHDTFYCLCTDRAGQAWAVGPGTGICRVDRDVLVPLSTGEAPHMSDVFALVPLGGDLLLMGESGLVVCCTTDGSVADLTNEYDLRGAQAELNAAAVDDDGAVWLATDRGVLRLASSEHPLMDQVMAVIVSVRQGGEELLNTGRLELPPDRDFISIRFTGLHYAAPEDLRFAYRLIGADTTVRFTRDREMTFSHLPPGDYRFEVAASANAGPFTGPWTPLTFTVLRPWWRTPWATIGAVLIIALITALLVRAREVRLRLHERMEQEKVSFQMQVLRSQVNPHFLFNSFNTLIDLIEEAPGKAVKHVEQLSDFFREILQVRDKELIPLRDELRLVDTYFLLEQRRFGDRITLRTNLVRTALDALVPPLTVQLLVENALKHNKATSEEPLVVTISATPDELVVSNPFRPRETAAKSTGFGIESIRQRFTAISTRPVHIGRVDDTFVARIPLLRSMP